MAERAQRRLGQPVPDDAPRSDVVDRARALRVVPAAAGQTAGRRQPGAGSGSARWCAGQQAGHARVRRARACAPGSRRRGASRTSRPSTRSAARSTTIAEANGAHVSSSCAAPPHLHRPPGHRTGEQHRVEGRVVGGVVAVAAGVLDVLDRDVSGRRGRAPRAMASRSRWMPWLWLQTCTPAVAPNARRRSSARSRRARGTGG